MADINIPRGPLDDEPRDAIRADWEKWAQAKRDAIAQTLDGIEMGAYDRRIAEWLAGWEPSTVATVCAWIGRARQQATEGRIVLDEPTELGLTWPDGSDLLTVTQYGLTLHVDGEPWHLSAAYAREMAAHLAAGADAVDAAGGEA